MYTPRRPESLPAPSFLDAAAPPPRRSHVWAQRQRRPRRRLPGGARPASRPAPRRRRGQRTRQAGAGCRPHTRGAASWRCPLASSLPPSHPPLCTLGCCAGAAKWAAAERRLSLAAVALGLAVFLLSWRYLYQFTEMGGMALGGVLVVSGAAGYVGGRRRSANIVNLQLVASLIGILLAFNMISEVRGKRGVCVWYRLPASLACPHSTTAAAALTVLLRCRADGEGCVSRLRLSRAGEWRPRVGAQPCCLIAPAATPAAASCLCGAPAHPRSMPYCFAVPPGACHGEERGRRRSAGGHGRSFWAPE